MRLSDFLKIGGFRPIVLPHYASDYEFTIRASRMGMQLVSDVTCCLKVDTKTTGVHTLPFSSLNNFWMTIFSNKSVQNPFMWTAFILLSCPLKHKTRNILRVWLNFFTLFYQLIKFWLIDKKIMLFRLKKPLRAILGSGPVGQKGWLSTDVTHLNVVSNKDWKKYFDVNSIEALLAEHVWEHLDEAEGTEAAKNCFTYLKPGGYLRIAVPDGFHPSKNYIDMVKPMGNGVGSDDHKMLFNHVTLATMLESAGFVVELLEYYDKNGVFHKKDWDPKTGLIRRSVRFDDRNMNTDLNYTSLIVDAWKINGRTLVQ